MTQLWVRYDVAVGGLVDFRERRKDFLGPSALFESSWLGLLVGGWSELSFNG